MIDGTTPESTQDGRFPARLDREYEEQLLDLCTAGEFEAQRWRQHGPAFFMAGLAVMLASVPEFDRRSLLDLAEALHAGSSQVGVFALWLERSPLRPSRFLPMLTAELHRAARRRLPVMLGSVDRVRPSIGLVRRIVEDREGRRGN